MRVGSVPEIWPIIDPFIYFCIGIALDESIMAMVNQTILFLTIRQFWRFVKEDL